MPVPPAELTAEVTVDGPAAGAVAEAAAATGIALDTGPGTTALAGARDEVLDGLRPLLEAALDAGAMTVTVKLEAPRDVRPGG
jgi:uncharacterized protein YqgV (UPF0045/DUF77 family)